MGYFTNKKNGTVESVAGKLTNMVKEGLSNEKNRYNNEINFNTPEFKQKYREDEKFSGGGVDSIFAMVSDEYQQYNAQYRYRTQEIAEDRKHLFNPE